MNHLNIFSRYTKSIIRLSRTIRPIPIPRILNYLPRTRIQLPHKVQVQKIKEQLEQESQQLIKEPNQINNVTQIQF